MWSKVIANVVFAVSIVLGSVVCFAADTSGSRVLIIEHPSATQAFSPQGEPIETMVRQGILRFTGTQNESSAWRSLLSTQDTVGIKVHSAPGPTSGTRPQVVAALIDSLLRSGISTQQIVIWDRREIDLRQAGFIQLGARFNVEVAAALETGYNTNTFYTSPLLGKLVYGDVDFGAKGDGVGRNSYLTKLLTRRITKIINVTPLLNHNQAGVSGALYGLTIGSVDNILRFEEPERLATAVPEIYAMPELADRVVLNIVDALICQYRGEERSLLHYSTALNELWFSKDPVAADALAIQVLDRTRPGTNITQNSTLQIYSNAQLMDLGIADTDRIKIERIKLPDQTRRAEANKF